MFIALMALFLPSEVKISNPVPRSIGGPTARAAVWLSLVEPLNSSRNSILPLVTGCQWARR